MKRIFLVVLLLLAFCMGNADARLRWLSPRGANTNAGTDSSITGAWQTLGYADGNLIAGDTLFVLGGRYVSLSDSATVPNSRNQFHLYSGGTSYTNQITIKAFGDSIAYFAGTGDPLYASRTFCSITGNADWITIDGWSYLTPTDSLYLVFECRGSKWIYNSPDSCATSANWPDIRKVFELANSGGQTPDHVKITGIEIDGNFPPYAIINNVMMGSCGYPQGAEAVMWGGPARYGIHVSSTSASQQLSDDTIMSCYIHDIYYPCGDGGFTSEGDGDWSCGLPLCDNPTTFPQGTGESIYIWGAVRKFYIADNTIENAAHAAITVEGQWLRADAIPTIYPSFGKIVNNKVYNRWGGGIYVTVSPHYVLVEGNLVVHSGESTSKTKAGMSLAGVGLTVRNNVIYTPLQNWPALDLYGQYTSSVIKSDSNYVYNNTVFGAHFEGITLAISNDTVTRCSIKDNRIFNNIFYKSFGENANFSGHPKAEIALYLYEANDATNWIYPDAITSTPYTTSFGGNKFFNNCAKKTPADSTAYIVAYQQDTDWDDTYSMIQYSFDTLEANDPTAWGGNISENPLLVSEDPDGAGIFSNWWNISAGSPCIDAGTYINDPIGAYVNSIYPGYGWDSLEVIGSQHDIGAYEYTVTEEESCTVVITAPMNSPILGTPAQWHYDTVHNITWTATGGPTSKIELYKAAVLQGTITTSTPNDGTYEWTVNAYGGGLDDDYTIVITVLTYPSCADTSDVFAIIGTTSCSVYPATLTFGNIAIDDSTAAQTFLITNTGDYDIYGSIINISDDFDITTGGGAFTLTPFQTRTVGVRFNPVTGGAKTAYMLTSISECSFMICYGGALLVDPATIPFPDTEIGDCADPIALTLTNTGTGTIAGTIYENCQDFSIVSGDGAYSLTAGQSRIIYLLFCPLSHGAKSCELNY